VLESCHQNCMTYTSAECTVENSCWWAEELPETCRVSWQNKFGKLVRLFGFIKKKFVTMHGHMNVKFALHISFNPCHLHQQINITPVKQIAKHFRKFIF